MLIGVDIGGTFTDLVGLSAQGLQVHKLLSTPAAPEQALLQGVAELPPAAGLVHGTTVATNALLERRGAATALITTQGFGDVLEIGRGTRPVLYDLNVTRPPALVPAAWRCELRERLDARGSILQALDEQQLAGILDWLEQEPVTAIAICTLHSPLNPLHEQLIATAAQARQNAQGHARFFVSASHEVLAEPREYERCSTTVVNAYVGPVLERYLAALEQGLAGLGISSLRIMASDGGSMAASAARRLGARTVLSGPAGGVVGALALARQAGYPRIISFDMGGTSTDVALCDGAPPQSAESEIGGLPVRLPAIDIHTVGAGGGSIARIDAGGALRVGPHSAGADPGPACYGRGTQATTTDANLVLGRLRADRFLGGRMRLDLERARAALAPLAAQLGVSIEQAALGVIQVANAAMERAIRTVTVERGEDPRSCTLLAFGGAGPLHAAHLAQALGVPRVLVPRHPGVLSALGMLSADVTRDYARAVLQPLAQLSLDQLAAQAAQLCQRGSSELLAEGFDPAQCRLELGLDLRYAGQSFEITTPLLSLGPSDQPVLPQATEIGQRFHGLHERRYSYALPQRAIEAVTLRLKAIGRRQLTLPATAPSGDAEALTVEAYPDDQGRALPTLLLQRAALRPGERIQGPALFTQLDATTVLPPHWQAEVLISGDLVLSQQDQ